MLLVLIAASMFGCSSGEQSPSPSEDHLIEVEFDGTRCAVAGPATAPAGDYTFVYTNLSNREDVQLGVRNYVDGHTHEDLVAAQRAAGGEGVDFPRPAWVHTPALSLDRPELDLDDDQRQFDHTLKAGPHGVLVYAERSPSAIWLCGPLDVVP